MPKKKHCELLALYSLLGNKWTLPLLFELGREPLSFNDLRKRTKNMINTTLLSQTLQELQRYKVLLIEEKERRVYSLSAEGVALLRMLSNLKHWAERNTLCVGEQCIDKSCMECGYFI